MWSPKGGELFYEQTSASKIMVAAYTASGRVFQPEKPRPWASTSLPLPLSEIGGLIFDASPDGKRLAVLLKLPDQTQAIPSQDHYLPFQLHRRTPPRRPERARGTIASLIPASGVAKSTISGPTEFCRGHTTQLNSVASVRSDSSQRGRFSDCRHPTATGLRSDQRHPRSVVGLFAPGADRIPGMDNPPTPNPRWFTLIHTARPIRSANINQQPVRIVELMRAGSRPARELIRVLCSGLVAFRRIEFPGGPRFVLLPLHRVELVFPCHSTRRGLVGQNVAP